MSIHVKERLAASAYIYGPLTKEEAFGVNVHSYATFFEGAWYAGTSVEYPPLADKFIDIPEPEIVQQSDVIDVETIEQPQ
jgi:hypothetical protein